MNTLSVFSLLFTILSGLVQLLIYGFEEVWRRKHYEDKLFHTPVTQTIIYIGGHVVMTVFFAYASWKYTEEPTYLYQIIIGSGFSLCFALVSLLFRALRTSGHAISAGVRTTICLVLLSETEDTSAFVVSLVGAVLSVSVPPRSFHTIQ